LIVIVRSVRCRAIASLVAIAGVIVYLATRGAGETITGALGHRARRPFARAWLVQKDAKAPSGPSSAKDLFRSPRSHHRTARPRPAHHRLAATPLRLGLLINLNVALLQHGFAARLAA
jgi:hypothetical protein